MSERKGWTLDLPAGLLHAWPGEAGGEWEARVERLVAAPGDAAGVVALSPGLLAVVPVGGDPAVLDAAVSYGRLLVRGPTGAEPIDARLLVSPGRARVAAAGTETLHDPLLADLQQKPPQLDPGEVHLTGRAAHTLEGDFGIEPAATYEGPAGRSVSLFRIGPGDGERPWRNAEILGRHLRGLPREELEAALRDALAGGGVARLSGPFGCGKTRLAMTALGGSAKDAARRRPRRLVVPSRRIDAPSLAEQLTALYAPLLGSDQRGEVEALAQRIAEGRRDRLFGGPGAAEREAEARAELSHRLRGLPGSPAATRGPSVLVIDDLEAADPTDLELLAGLAAGGEATPALALVGRTGIDWPESLTTTPEVRVTPLDEGEIQAFADNLLAGLSLPPTVEERLLESAAGNPFMLEEGVAAMIHRRALRRFYGSFFFSGGDDTTYVPSPRLIQHVEAEAGRLGVPAPLRLLAVAGAPAPTTELRSAISLAGARSAADTGWAEIYRVHGWLREEDTPWGRGIGFSSAALAAAVGSTLAPAAAARARRVLGELLSGLSQEPAARWAAYRLLAGSSAAIPVLLDLVSEERADTAAGVASDDALLAALIRELVNHRESGGDPETELKLLLAMLPLALRTAHLEGLAEELKHAMHLALQHSEGGPERMIALARLKADLDRREGRLSKAEETLRSALKTSQQVDDRGKAALLLQLGRVLIARQRLDEAESLFRRVLGQVERPGHAALAASCHFYLGNIALHRCRYQTAFDHHRRALDLRLETHGPIKPRIASLTAVGAASLALGRYPEALQHYQEAEDRAREAGDDEELSYVLLGIGRALSRLGDFAAASAPLRQVLALREASGDGLGEAVARLAVAENHLALDRPREALAEAREAHFRLSLLTDGKPLGQAEQLLGRIQLTRRKPKEARNYLLRALHFHNDRGDLAEAAFDRAFLLEAALGDQRLEDVMILARDLGRFLAGPTYPELGEQLDYCMYKALEWLCEKGEGSGDPSEHLRRAYRTLLAKAERLRPDLRQVFLFQIPENEAIVVAATRAGLSE